VVTKAEKVDAIVAYLGTPAELRPVPTLRQLALSLGARPDGHWYELCQSPEVIRAVVGVSSTLALAHLSTILQILVDRAIGGNVRAADVLLKHIREVVSRLPAEGAPRPLVPLHEHLHDVARAAGELNRVADELAMGKETGEGAETSAGIGDE